MQTPNDVATKLLRLGFKQLPHNNQFVRDGSIPGTVDVAYIIGVDDNSWTHFISTQKQDQSCRPKNPPK